MNQNKLDDYANHCFTSHTKIDVAIKTQKGKDSCIPFFSDFLPWSHAVLYHVLDLKHFILGIPNSKSKFLRKQLETTECSVPFQVLVITSITNLQACMHNHFKVLGGSLWPWIYNTTMDLQHQITSTLKRGKGRGKGKGGERQRHNWETKRER